MAAIREQYQEWVPRSVADTGDGSASPSGAFNSLQNLIWDPSTPHTLICRPANTVEIDFSGWDAAPGNIGVITAEYQISNIIYGLVGITSGTFAGLDYPFAYNTLTSSFIAIASVTTAKCPTSQSTSGAWVPPQMTLTGVDLVVTHIGFPGGMGAFFGWFDVTTPASPTWNVGNTSTNALPSVPQACGTFNNRTRFACGNAAYYTDTLALAMTNSNQSQTIGDNTNIVAFAGLPVSTTSQAILQGLLAFKNNYISLITGDPATSNLGANEISDSVGTSATRSVVSTPEGVRFMAVDGIRNINFLSIMSNPDDDLAMPFIYAVQPSRVCAAFNSNIYRICTQNGNKPGSPYEDYWYDFRRKGWTGPHTFQYDVAVPIANDFAIASNSILGKVWNSYVVQSHGGFGTTFTENGVALNWAYTPAPMTSLNNLYANSLLRSTIDIAAPASGQTYNFTAQDESGSALATGSITQSVNQSTWGSFIWGHANWGAVSSGIKPITIPWNQAAVANKFVIMGQGISALNFKIGRLHSTYKRLNYLLN